MTFFYYEVEIGRLERSEVESLEAIEGEREFFLFLRSDGNLDNLCVLDLVTVGREFWFG